MAIAPEILLVNKDYICEYTNANNSIDADRINSCVILAQDLHIESALGTDLMNAVKGGSYTNLLDNYIRRAVCWWAYSYLLAAVYVKIEEGGLFMRNADNGDQITVEEYTKMRREAESVARSYTKKLTDYVNYNADSFPELRTSQFPDKHAQGENYQHTKIRISGGKRATSPRSRDNFI